MNILITGIHGFVGSNFVEYLKGSHTIYGLDIVSPTKEGIVKTFSWQNLDDGVIPQVDAIIHLAGKAHDTKNTSAADVYFEINTNLTKKVFDYFLANDAKKFIFFSSVKAAADVVESDKLDENIIPKPVGPYGESKIKAEEYILSKELPDKKSVYIMRPCMIHGPGNKGNLNLLYSVVSRHIPWPLGKFDNLRTFTSIDNLCFVIEGLLTKNVQSGIYNMADDEALSTNKLITIMCKALNRKAHIWRLPKSLVNLIVKLGDVLHLPINTFRMNKLTENYVVSNKKIKAALGLKQMPVRAEDGLIKTIKSFKKA